MSHLSHPRTAATQKDLLRPRPDFLVCLPSHPFHALGPDITEHELVCLPRKNPYCDDR